MNNLVQCEKCGEWYLDCHSHEFFKQVDDDFNFKTLVRVPCDSDEWIYRSTTRGLSCETNPRKKPEPLPADRKPWYRTFWCK